MPKVTYPLDPNVTTASGLSSLHASSQEHTISNGWDDVVWQQPGGPDIETHAGHEYMNNTHLNEAGKIGQRLLQVPLSKSRNSRLRKPISEKGIQKKRPAPKRIIHPEPIFPEVIHFNENGIRIIDVLENRGHLDDAQKDFGRTLRQCHIKIRVC